MNSLSRPWIMGFCILLYGYHALASGPVMKDPITLDDVIALVVEHNPTLKAADYDTQAAAARIRQVTQNTPWRAGLELENFAGSGTLHGSDALETTLSLSRMLQTGDQPQLNGELARQEAALLSTEQQTRRLDLLAESAQRFLAVAIAQERLTITQEAQATAQRNLAIIKHRLQAGRTSKAELATATIALARAELQTASVESEMLSACQVLATSWGDSRANFSRVSANVYDLPRVAPFATLETHLDRNPDLTRFSTAERINTARARLAMAGRHPDVDLTAGVRHLSESDDTALLFSVSVPLGNRRRAAPAEEEAQAIARREPLAYEEHRLALYSTLFMLHQQLTQSRAAVITLQERILPAAEQALADYRRGYRAGRYAWLDLINAQNTLLDSRIELLDRAAAYHRIRIEIDRLTGGTLMTGDAS